MPSPGVTATAPGKIILSGEHAVVSGERALVTAVTRSVTATAMPIDAATVEIHAGDTSLCLGIPKETDALRRETRARYDAFTEGRLPIQDVLRHPLDLIAVCWTLVQDRLAGPHPAGVRIEIQTDLPAGSGMGSSAAATVAVAAALLAMRGRPLDLQSVTDLSLSAERFQHGRPSGADSFVSAHGGCVRFQKEILPERIALPHRSLWLADTGTPESTTGECVSDVQGRFGTSGIWDAFGRVCEEIERALCGDNGDALCDGLRRNHALLREIGVVPDRVDRFVRDVESAGGAAKVCGAGAVRGAGAGVVWIVSASPPGDLCRTYGYELFEVETQHDGVHIIQ